MRKAGTAVWRGNYQRAIQKYLATLKEDSLNFKANTEYGLLLIEYLNDPDKAGTYLLRAERISQKDTMIEVIYGLARHYHFRDQYSKAITYYKRTWAQIDSTEEDGAVLLKQIKREIENCKYALRNPSSGTKKIKISNVGDGVNTFYPEYVPIVTKDDKTMMFTSRRENNTGNKIDDFDSKYFEDMFIAKNNSSGKFADAHPFSVTDMGLKDVMNTKGHDAVVSMSSTNNKFYIYRKSKIYESEYINNEWSGPKALGDSIKSLTFQTHICISMDGKTVFYSCEVPDKSGNVDIYKSEKTASGAWSLPVNLGNEINTSESEESPFLSEDGQTLYFSSKGHPGYGGYDIFKSKLVNGKWSSCENMGRPFNSSGDDIYLTIDQNETQGYLSSSRAGGYGDMDIYKVAYEKPFTNFVPDALGRISITMPDTVFLNDVVAFGATSSKLPPSEFTSYYWMVSDSILATQDVTASYTFSKAGVYAVKLEAETKDGKIIDYKKDIIVRERPVAVVGTPDKFVLENIYFGFNRSDLNTGAIEALERNLKILKAHPQAKIELQANTDARGSSNYNIALSKRRADAVIMYLKAKGFTKDKISNILANGESKLANHCVDGVKCDIKEHKLNRRVEFKIIETTK